jgi:hypothetical protein
MCLEGLTEIATTFIIHDSLPLEWYPSKGEIFFNFPTTFYEVRLHADGIHNRGDKQELVLYKTFSRAH